MRLPCRQIAPCGPQDAAGAPPCRLGQDNLQVTAQNPTIAGCRACFQAESQLVFSSPPVWRGGRIWHFLVAGQERFCTICVAPAMSQNRIAGSKRQGAVSRLTRTEIPSPNTDDRGDEGLIQDAGRTVQDERTPSSVALDSSLKLTRMTRFWELAVML